MRDDNVTNRYIVSADYTTEAQGIRADQVVDPDAGTPLANQTIGETQTSWGAAFEPITMQIDVDGRPALNAVGRPFDPPLETDAHYQIVNIEVNRVEFDTQFFSEYINTVNSDPFMGFNAGEVKCASISASNQYSGTFRYVNARFEFHV